MSCLILRNLSAWMLNMTKILLFQQEVPSLVSIWIFGGNQSLKSFENLGKTILVICLYFFFCFFWSVFSILCNSSIWDVTLGWKGYVGHLWKAFQKASYLFVPNCSFYPSINGKTTESLFCLTKIWSELVHVCFPSSLPVE